MRMNAYTPGQQSNVENVHSEMHVTLVYSTPVESEDGPRQTSQVGGYD